MARTSLRLSSGTNNSSTSTHKRAASNTAIPKAAAKRTKTKKEPLKKSQYFKENDDDPQDAGVDSDDSLDASVSDEEASNFGNDNNEDSAEDEDEYDDEDSEEERKPSKKKTPAKGMTSSATIRTKDGELWRPGVKAGLGPGTQVVIKKPQARPAGKTPYQDETIHANTLLFLNELKENNERQWLKMHDAVFRQAEKDWHSFVDKLTERLVEIDDTIPELPVKDVIFRIYRDVRFTSDPTPYKPHFSAAWSRTGRKGPYAHYYVQIGPGNSSFVGCGLWHPEAAPTSLMRRDIDRNPRHLKDVLMNEGMRKELLGGVSKNERKAVDAFVSANSENALKTKPKGYDGDHADIDLLRLRNYTVGRKLTEDEVVGNKSLDTISNLFSCMRPFITYLNSVVMPDEPESADGDTENGSEDDDDDEEEDEE